MASKVVPAVGIAAEGHRPGANFPTAAEHENSQQNRLTALARWVFLGTFNPDVDAHVVETAADGRAGLHGLDVLNLLDQTAQTITSSAVAFPAMLITATGGTTLVQADPGNSDGICFLAQTKAAAFPVGYQATMAGSGPGARGVQVIADATTTGAGIESRHEGSGQAISVTHLGTPSGGSAVTITANGPGVTRGLDVVGTGAGESLRVRSTSAPTGNGIFADMLNTTGFALRARTTGGSTTASRALRAEARGAATAIEATSDTGDGVRAQATGSGGASLYLPGRATDPTNTFNGRKDFNTTTKTWVSSDQDASNYRDDWSSRGGLVVGADDSGVVTNNSSVTYVAACTLVLTGQDAPHRNGSVIVLSFTCGARSTVNSGSNTIDVQIYDVTAGAPVVTNSGVGTSSTSGYRLPGIEWTGGVAVAQNYWADNIVLEVKYTVPLAGDRTFEARFKTATANGVQVRNAMLKPYGAITAP